MKLAIFLLGFFSSFKISLFGEVFLGEIILGSTVFWTLIKGGLYGRRVILPPYFNQIWWLLWLWFFCQVTSDFVNETDVSTAIKGALTPIFVLLVYWGLSVIFSGKIHLSFFLGIFSGYVFFKYFSGQEYFMYNPWKFGGGTAIGAAVYMIVNDGFLKNKRLPVFVSSSILVFISLINSSRALAGFFFLTAICCLFVDSKRYTALIHGLLGDRNRFLKTVFFLFISFFAIDKFLYLVFTNDFFLSLLTDSAAEKYKGQAESGYGVILGGRSELLVSVRAFLDKPFLGHGSWAENAEYVYMKFDFMSMQGDLTMNLSQVEKSMDKFLIPTHSFLMGVVVWAGIFAAGFWIKVLAICTQALQTSRFVTSPFYLFIVLNVFWNIFFSPFGADGRWINVVFIWLIALKLRDEENAKNLNYRNQVRY